MTSRRGRKLIIDLSTSSFAMGSAIPCLRGQKMGNCFRTQGLPLIIGRIGKGGTFRFRNARICASDFVLSTALRSGTPCALRT